MTEAYIVAYGRSPICKGKEEGTYYYSKPEEIAAQVLRGVLATLGESFPTHAIEDVIVGCSVPENLQGMNIARKISLLAGFVLLAYRVLQQLQPLSSLSRLIS